LRKTRTVPACSHTNSRCTRAPDAGHGSGANAIAVGFVNPVAYCLSPTPLGNTVCAGICKSGATKNVIAATRCKGAIRRSPLGTGVYMDVLGMIG